MWSQSHILNIHLLKTAKKIGVQSYFIVYQSKNKIKNSCYLSHKLLKNKILNIVRYFAFNLFSSYKYKICKS